jgi:hypothetical protein
MQRAGLASFYYLPTDLTIKIEIVQADGNQARIDLANEGVSSWIEIPATRYEGVWRKKYSGGQEDFNALPEGLPPPKSGLYRQDKDGYLYCNNIIVGDIVMPDDNMLRRAMSLGDLRDGVFGIATPSVAVQDNGGYVPLDLARKGFRSPDTQLFAALKHSAAVECIASAFLASGADAPSLCFEPWNKGELLFSMVWNKFLFFESGYSLFDFALLGMHGIDHFACIHCNSRDDLSVLEDMVHAARAVAIRSDYFQISNKRLLIDHIRDGREHWPSWYGSDPGLPDRSDWVGYHALEYEAAASCLALGSVPNYIRSMIEERETFVAGGNEYLLFGGGSEPAEWQTLKEWCSVLANSSSPNPAKRAVTLWKQRKVTRHPTTVVSQAWKQSFSLPAFPYRPNDRRSLLLDGSPVAEFIKKYRVS